MTSPSMTSEPQIPSLRLSQDPAADALLARNPFALLVGMVLDQQIPITRALAGPAIIAERTGRDLTPAEVAEYDPEQFTAVLSRPPAVHRFPAAMAERIQKLAAHLNEVYGGDVTRMWSDESTGADVVQRFEQLPGFGKTKARVLLALLGKQLGVTPAGWREASAPFGEDGVHISLADVVDQASLDAVRNAKTERKKAKKIVTGRVKSGAGVATKETGRKNARKTQADRAVAAQTARSAVASTHIVAGTGVTGVRSAR